MAATMPEMNRVTIPGLKSTGKNNSRLLRRPRAPPKLPPIPNDVPSTTPSENLSPTQQFFDRFDYNSPYDAQMMGYLNRESPTPSLASPPPSASSPTRHTFNMHNFTSPTSNVTSFISKDDMRYVLDPLYRGRTALGTYVDGKSLLKPFKPRGPDGLPPRKPKKNPELMYFESDDMRYYEPPAFTLETFAAHVSQVKNIPLCQVQKMFHSRATYDKLTQLLYEENIQKKYDTVYIQQLDGSQLPLKEPRVPQMQLLIEMAAMIKQHVRDLMQTNVKSVIKPMPKYSPSYRGESVPHTEIILYEDDSVEKASQRMQRFRETEMPSKDSVFKSATTRHFMGGSGRSHSPLTLPENEMISPSELAILDSLISGGSALSLKAHFIADLPDITPLMKSITYLNLSFNNFKSFPLEVLRITQLEILKMRDNPLRDLPPDIHRLENLRTLVVSFCLIETIPSGLYQIKSLQHLDVSYNKLTSLSSEMRNLEKLCELNVEGNQLPALPGGTLRLPLTSVNVRNNFMHPLFWKDHCKNKPQRLTDLAALHFVRNNLHKQIAELPEAVVKVLYTCETCDTCLGPLFGPGLTCIRPIRKAFGIRMLPFLFRSCQPSCLQNFRSCSAAELYQLLYGVEADAEPSEDPPQEAEPNAPTPSPR